MITPGNYCTHAIEMLMALSAHAEIGHYPKEVSRSTIDRGVAMLSRDCARLLLRAEKFVMPDWGRIFTEDEFEVVTEIEIFNRLPYPVIACEFACDYDEHNTMIPGEGASSKRIALAIEMEAMAAIAPGTYALCVKNNTPGDGFIVMPVPWFDEGQLWTPPPSMAWCSRTEEPKLLKATSLMTPLGITAYDVYPREERAQRAMRDAADEVISITHLLYALAMERTTHTVIPAPAKLNKKRERSGKPPIFEYKVLDIVADLMATPREITGRPHGKHASPRLHKRRGHIRRLASGRTTWVRNTIVGKPGSGEISKDYRVTK